MNRGMPYVICDTDGTPVTAEEAAVIIAKRWTVPAGVRGHRRSKKGKAPQAISTRRQQRGDLPRAASSTRSRDDVNSSTRREGQLIA
jgi:hypothetical protein